MNCSLPSSTDVQLRDRLIRMLHETDTSESTTKFFLKDQLISGLNRQVKTGL